MYKSIMGKTDFNRSTESGSHTLSVRLHWAAHCVLLSILDNIKINGQQDIGVCSILKNEELTVYSAFICLEKLPHK